MKALFHFTGYSFSLNSWHRFLMTVPDNTEDRYEIALAHLQTEYPLYSRWYGTFVCLTNDDVFKEL